MNDTKGMSRPLRIAAFMSGSGTNLRRIIELQKRLNDALFQVVVIFTDTKDEEKCSAGKIAEEYNIPLIVNDIMDYYRAKGHATKKDMRIREEYDAETATAIAKHDVDLVALCGYMSIVTFPVYSRFLTLNVHPADLTKLDSSGRRVYAGCMGAGCIRQAIISGDSEVRSTVHVVNGELDGGPVVALSPPLKVEFGIDGHSSEELSEAAEAYQDLLKEKGDWVVYPETIRMIAEGRMRIEKGNVYVDGKKVENGYRL
ncbi:hypothetical protein HYU15_01950 [Candidatus Woesearchaeota archaeon]|nr:hypothetical protein [Candidatus Woesearchaeota archaeon]